MKPQFFDSEVTRFRNAFMQKCEDVRSYNEFKTSSYDKPENCPTSADIDSILIQALSDTIRSIRAASIDPVIAGVL